MGTYRAIILGGIWLPMGALASAERVYQADGDDNAHTHTYADAFTYPRTNGRAQRPSQYGQTVDFRDTRCVKEEKKRG